MHRDNIIRLDKSISTSIRIYELEFGRFAFDQQRFVIGQQRFVIGHLGFATLFTMVFIII